MRTLWVGVAFFALSFCDPAIAAPIQIDTIQQLDQIGTTLPLSGDYVLGANINAAGYSFAPIATEGSPFTGTLDGNGFSISDLTTSGPLYGGLFGFIGSSGVVENLTLSNLSSNTSLGADYNGSSYYPSAYAGSLAAINAGTISSVSANGTVAANGSGSVNFTPLFVGGLVGQNQGTINSSNAAVSVSGAASNFMNVGGLVGNNVGAITASTAAGNVTTNGGGNNNAQYTVGGLVGSNSGDITRSSASASVADSGDVARLIRDHVARCSDMMSLG